MRLVRLRIALVLSVCLALVAALGVIIRQHAQLAACRQQRAADLKSLLELREILRQHEIQKTPASSEDRNTLDDSRAEIAKRDATIARLDRDLKESHADTARLQAQLLKSNEECEKALGNADERYQQGQADWQHQLDALKQDFDAASAEVQASRQRIAGLEAANAEVQVSRQRIADLEAANAKVRKEYSDSSVRTAELRRMAASLKDVDQRRDAFLASIIRHYRDITTQFRAMSGMLDSTREQGSNPCGGAALTRIQNAVSLADDDLRQLNDLNAQARQLEEKLVKK